MKAILVLISLQVLHILAAPQTGGLIVPASTKAVDTDTTRQTRGFAFPEKTNNRFRAPAKAVETRQQELVATDPESRQGILSNFLTNIPDLQLALDARMPVLKVPLSSLSRLTESASGLGTSSSLLKLNMGTIAALGGLVGLATLFYPQIFSVLGLSSATNQYRTNGEITSEDIANNVNRVLERYNVDANSCLKMAMCTVGRRVGAKKVESRATGSGTSTVELLDTVMNLSAIKDGLTKRGFRQARDFGEHGGDCDSFNKENKCPMSAATWRSLLSKVF